MKTFYRISPWLLQTVIWLPTRLVLKFFSKFTVSGAENLKRLPSGVIFAVNHSSELDPILLPAAFPFLHKLSPMFYTSREKSFYVNSSWRRTFYGGFLFRIWGAHSVTVGINNYEKSLKTHIGIVKDGGSVLIFPEGRKTRDGNLQIAKGGVAYLSYATRAPIVPVAISGAFRTSFIDFFLRRRKICVTFGMPIYSDELFPADRKIEFGGARDSFVEAAQSVMVKIAALRAPLSVTDSLSPIQTDKLLVSKTAAKS